MGIFVGGPGWFSWCKQRSAAVVESLQVGIRCMRVNFVKSKQVEKARKGEIKEEEGKKKKKKKKGKEKKEEKEGDAFASRGRISSRSRSRNRNTVAR